MKYDDITKEEWEIYRAVEKACLKEDLKCVLEDDYERTIDEFDDEDINAVLEQYDDYRSNSGEWREDMHFAINKWLDLGE